jgi:beta-glucanase (GH16 family)
VAEAFAKSNSGFYDDEFIFRFDGTYTHKTNGDVFGKADYLNQTFGNTGQLINDNNEIEKYTLQNYQTTFSVAKQNGQNKLSFQDKGFVGFFVGQHEFTIESYDSNNLFVRVVDDQNRAWYVWLTNQVFPTDFDQYKDTFTNLVWQDEFDYNGKIDDSKWDYEIRNQWYNEEVQATTDRLDNVKVENGVLKIIAKRETDPAVIANYGGKQFTSGRIKSHDRLDFKYGRVDIRAKLPGKQGTWPALWMLGSNYDEIDWPTCGEIDIMEHAGNALDTIHATVHYGVSAYTYDGDKTNEHSNVSTDFNIYSVVWTEKAITFLVNDTPFHIVGNASVLPFNWNFYLILNVAVGGWFSPGNTADNLISDTMEVDYVRVYQ